MANSIPPSRLAGRLVSLFPVADIVCRPFVAGRAFRCLNFRVQRRAHLGGAPRYSKADDAVHFRHAAKLHHNCAAGSSL